MDQNNVTKQTANMILTTDRSSLRQAKNLFDAVSNNSDYAKSGHHFDWKKIFNSSAVNHGSEYSYTDQILNVVNNEVQHCLSDVNRYQKCLNGQFHKIFTNNDIYSRDNVFNKLQESMDKALKSTKPRSMIDKTPSMIECIREYHRLYKHDDFWITPKGSTSNRYDFVSVTPKVALQAISEASNALNGKPLNPSPSALHESRVNTHETNHQPSKVTAKSKK